MKYVKYVAVFLILARPGLADRLGEPAHGLSATEIADFVEGHNQFIEVEGVPNGLGPVFNDTSCGACHSVGAVGGGGPTPKLGTRFGKLTSGVFDPMTANGGSLLQSQGIGIQGACNFVPETVPGTATINIHRRPQPLFGLGLIDAVPSTSLDALAAQEALDHPSTAGRVNHVPSLDVEPVVAEAQLNSNGVTVTLANANVVGFSIYQFHVGDRIQSGVQIRTIVAINTIQSTVTTDTAFNPALSAASYSYLLATTEAGRFGWKAQVASLMEFSGDAYNNEMGITTPMFPVELCPQGVCSCTPPLADPENTEDQEKFANFMKLLAPPRRLPATTASTGGDRIFNALGCVNCHTPTLTTGPSTTPSLDRRDFHPYSDFLLHDMGSLGDGIVQGISTQTEMRTAPLWGLRFSTIFLHDGRVSTVANAILAHAGQGQAARDAYAALASGDQAKLLAFLQLL